MSAQITSDTFGSKARSITVWIACIIVGLIILAGGTGKLFGYGELPGQSIEFLNVIIPDWLGTPAFYEFIGEVLFPWVLPLIETLLGIFLIIGFVPRLMATITLPLSGAFLANNAWTIAQGTNKFPDCACFGIWEEIFGIISPLQSLFLDIGMIILAVVIIIVYPGKYLASRRCLTRLAGKDKAGK
ncbi:MAG TPA: hypothetical protein DCX22_04145 [Dehalococcoidia bacterium]|nr:hypothetical protein [Dehalococcoidia bacterium]